MFELRDYLVFVLVLFNFSINGQNLVNNPSFEDTVTCPDNFHDLEKAQGWLNVSPKGVETPDYFNSCAPRKKNSPSVPKNFSGYQEARTGNGYAGFITYNVGGEYRELIGTHLTQKLVPNTRYYISFYVSLVDSGGKMMSNNIGVLFSSDTLHLSVINNYAHLNDSNVISDSVNWTMISGSFVADSAYSFISIGNFFQDYFTTKVINSSIFQYAAYYIDDVCVSKTPGDCNLYVGLFENEQVKKVYLIRITDPNGREVQENELQGNRLYFYHYSDGKTKKKIQLK